jgi:hypothetical protein
MPDCCGALAGVRQSPDAAPKLPQCLFGLSNNITQVVVHRTKLEPNNGCRRWGGSSILQPVYQTGWLFAVELVLRPIA